MIEHSREVETVQIRGALYIHVGQLLELISNDPTMISLQKALIKLLAKSGTE